MDLNTFAQRIATREGKADEQNIAQIKETLRCVDEELSGAFYPIVRLMPQPRKRNQQSNTTTSEQQD